MSSRLPGWTPETIDLDRPNAARVYDYLLGGGCNFEVDRVFAHRLLEALPESATILQHNRAFLGRAVRFCIERGIRQFLDLGSGIPTVGNVHEIAQRAAPDCRVVYVDYEPVAVAHSQLMLEHNDNADVVLADLLDADRVLDSAPVQRLIDFSQPMAVILAAVLHFVPDEANPYRSVARYVDAMASGSFLVLSHGALTDQARYRAIGHMYRQVGTQTFGRTPEQIQTFFTGTDIIEPGITWTSAWRPEFNPNPHSQPSMIYAAVGHKPSAT